MELHSSSVNRAWDIWDSSNGTISLRTVNASEYSRSNSFSICAESVCASPLWKDSFLIAVLISLPFETKCSTSRLAQCIVFWSKDSGTASYSLSVILVSSHRHKLNFRSRKGCRSKELTISVTQVIGTPNLINSSSASSCERRILALEPSIIMD